MSSMILIKFLVFILGIIIVILLLVYFNIITLNIGKNNSKTITTGTEINSNSTQLISQDDPLVFTNNTSQWVRRQIPQNKFQKFNATTISLGMNVTFITQTSSSSAGFLFSNGLTDQDRNNRGINLFYFLPNRQWVFSDITGPTVKHYPLLKPEDSKLNQRFTMDIASNGKSVVVSSLGAGLKRTITLNSSLYDTTNTMKLFVVLSPGSKISLAPLLVTTEN